MIFFTSDTHFYHKRICELAGRPWSSIEEMHEGLIANWNATVGPDDIVYHLGDVSFANTAPTLAVLSRLNGRIWFVWGNHDKRRCLRPGDEDLGHYAEIEHDGRKIVLCHYPLLTWNKAHRGSWHLHGHSHGTLDERNLGTTRLDVGVDGVAEYRPMSIDEIAEELRGREYEVVDQHGAPAPKPEGAEP